MKSYENSIWLKHKIASQLESIFHFIYGWNIVLEKKKREDLDEIKSYKGEEYGAHLDFFEDSYNHLYAHFLITIYSALEYDLSVLFHMKTYSFECFKCNLKRCNIKMKDLKYADEIDQLRIYCNAYKHNNGIKRSKDQKQEDIDYMSINVLDYYEKTIAFLSDVIEKVKNYKEQNN